MTLTGLRDNKVRHIVLDALFLTLALILSYVEFLIPLNGLIPIPGFKLGLANIVVLFAVYELGNVDALILSVLKVVLSSLLFGSFSSFFFALSGALLSFLVMIFAKYFLSKITSWIGLSALSAVFHNIGQLLAAIILLGESTVFWYLPYLVIAGLICGILTGTILCLTSNVLGKLLQKFVGGKLI